MNPSSRLVFGLLVQVAFLVLAVYLVVADSALPEASHVARVGLAAAVLAVGVLYGEVSRVRADMARLLHALKQDLSAGRDDRMAIDVLVAALSSDAPEKRELAHKHLVRLTGQTFPADPARWLAWWKTARPTYGPADGKGGPAGGNGADAPGGGAA